jgi:phage FluMu protein Com
MILHTNPEPSIVKIDSVDIKKTLKYSEALQKVADAGNKASEALRDVIEVIKGLKEVFPDESPTISDIDIGKWDLQCGVFGECYTFRCTKCGTNVVMPASCIREVHLPDKCPNCKSLMHGGTKND